MGLSQQTGFRRVAPLNKYPRYFENGKPTEHATRIWRGDIMLFCTPCKKPTYHIAFRKYRHNAGYCPATKTFYKCGVCGHATNVHAGNSKFIKVSARIREIRGGFK